MMKDKTKVIVLCSLLAVVSLVGCSNFVTNAQRTEVTTTHLVYGAYVGWTNYYIDATNRYASKPDQLTKLEEMRMAIKEARMKYAASVGVVDSWLTAYQSNTVSKAQVQSVVDASLASGSNIVWLITYLKSNNLQ